MIDSATAPYAALLLCWCLGAMLIAQALLNGDAPRSPERSSCSGR
jgi:hypothetical protein